MRVQRSARASGSRRTRWAKRPICVHRSLLKGASSLVEQNSLNLAMSAQPLRTASINCSPVCATEAAAVVAGWLVTSRALCRGRGRMSLTWTGTLRTTPTWAPVFIAEIDLPMSNIHRKKGWKLCMSKDATIAAFENSGRGNSPFPTFTVQSVDGDSAKLANNTMSVVAAKGPDGWHVDLDATLKNDPQIEMMVSMAGPMLKNMMRGLGEQFQLVTEEVKAGDFENASDVVVALEEKMNAAMGGLGGR